MSLNFGVAKVRSFWENAKTKIFDKCENLENVENLLALR